MSEKKGRPGPEQLPPAPPVTKLRRRGEKTEPVNLESKPWKAIFEMQTAKRYANVDQAGKLYELEAFGLPKLDQKFYQNFSEFMARNRRWMPFKEILQNVHDYYQGDPRNPEMPYAQDLLKKISEMEAVENKQARIIKFYSTLDIQQIDRKGVDGFFQMEKPDGEFVVAPVDITMKPVDVKMEQRLEKDIEADRTSHENLDVTIIDQVPIKRGDKFYEDAITYYAQKIHEILKKKMPSG